MKHIVGVKVQLHCFLTTKLDGGKWLTSRPGRIKPWKKGRYPLYMEVKKKVFFLAGIEPQIFYLLEKVIL